LLGAVITVWFGIETRGMNLENLDEVEYEDEDGPPVYDPTSSATATAKPVD